MRGYRYFDKSLYKPARPLASRRPSAGTKGDLKPLLHELLNGKIESLKAIDLKP
jgi:hypothetical protein